MSVNISLDNPVLVPFERRVCVLEHRPCDLQATIGSFEMGKEFDALMVDPTGGACFDTFTGDTLVDVFQKFINLGDDRNIRAVWVRGGLVLWK